MTLTRDSISGLMKISGTLDIDAVDALREALLDCFRRQPEAAADLSEVDGCDTAALQVLLAAQSSAASLGKGFRINAASASLLDTAAALGLSALLPSRSDGIAGAVREEIPDAA